MRKLLLAMVMVMPVVAPAGAKAQIPDRPPIQVQQPNQSAAEQGVFPEMTAADCVNLANHKDKYAVEEYSARQRFCAERLTKEQLQTTTHLPGVPALEATEADIRAMNAMSPSSGSDDSTTWGHEDYVRPDPSEFDPETAEPKIQKGPVKGPEEPNHSISGEPRTGDPRSMNSN